MCSSRRFGPPPPDGAAQNFTEIDKVTLRGGAFGEAAGFPSFDEFGQERGGMRLFRRHYLNLKLNFAPVFDQKSQNPHPNVAKQE